MNLLTLVVLIFFSADVSAQSFACVDLDAVTNQCNEWKELTILGVPDLTQEQSLTIITAYSAVLALIRGWGWIEITLLSRLKF